MKYENDLPVPAVIAKAHDVLGKHKGTTLTGHLINQLIITLVNEGLLVHEPTDSFVGEPGGWPLQGQLVVTPADLTKYFGEPGNYNSWFISGVGYSVILKRKNKPQVIMHGDRAIFEIFAPSKRQATEFYHDKKHLSALKEMVLY